MAPPKPRLESGRRAKLQVWWDKYTFPIAKGEDEARREYMSRVILMIMTALLTLFTLIVALGWAAGWFMLLDVVIMAAITAPVAGAWLVTLRGGWKTACYVPALVFLALGIYSTSVGGYLNSIILAYGIAIMLAGMLLGRQMAWLTVFFSLVGHLGIGWWIERSSLLDMMFVAVPYTGFLVGITVLQQFAEHRLFLALDQARQYAWQLNIEMEERKQTQERLVQRNRELLLLNQIIAAATSTLEIEKTLEFTIRELARGLQVTYAIAGLLDEQNEKLKVLATTAPSGQSNLAGYTIAVDYLRSYSERLVKQDYLILTRSEMAQVDELIPVLMRAEDLEAMLIVPIRVHAQLFGILGLASQGPRQFSSEEILLARNAAAAVAQAVDNARLYGHVQRLAIRDGLTDLLNRRGILEFGGREVERAQRFKRDLGVIFIDADGLKAINDRYGHFVGDIALRGLAEFIRTNTRDVDLVARYGGDEFVILLAETGLEQSLEIAYRLREYIQENPVADDDLEIYMTVSMGVTALTAETESLEALIEEADQAMYAAKQAGRNRIATP